MTHYEKLVTIVFRTIGILIAGVGLYYLLFLLISGGLFPGVPYLFVAIVVIPPILVGLFLIFCSKRIARFVCSGLDDE